MKMNFKLVSDTCTFSTCIRHALSLRKNVTLICFCLDHTKITYYYLLIGSKQMNELAYVLHLRPYSSKR